MRVTLFRSVEACYIIILYELFETEVFQSARPCWEITASSSFLFFYWIKFYEREKFWEKIHFPLIGVTNEGNCYDLLHFFFFRVAKSHAHRGSRPITWIYRFKFDLLMGSRATKLVVGVHWFSLRLGITLLWLNLWFVILTIVSKLLSRIGVKLFKVKLGYPWRYLSIYLSIINHELFILKSTR